MAVKREFGGSGGVNSGGVGAGGGSPSAGSGYMSHGGTGPSPASRMFMRKDLSQSPADFRSSNPIHPGLTLSDLGLMGHLIAGKNSLGKKIVVKRMLLIFLFLICFLYIYLNSLQINCFRMSVH
jgi:hypothetical protein